MDSVIELGKTAELLRMEQDQDFAIHEASLKKSNIQERRRNGVTWFPLRIAETGYGLGAYPFIVVERNPGDNFQHHFSNSSPVSLFTAAPGYEDSQINGTIGYIDDSRMKIFFRADDLPDWIDMGKIGVNLLFDAKSYEEMYKALNFFINVDRGRPKELRDKILGYQSLNIRNIPYSPVSTLNDSQNKAVQDILNAEDVAVVHGPPGTGKTTTLVHAITELLKLEKQILVCAPTNAATDYLTRSLSAKGVSVIRIGNVARVEEDTIGHTVDSALSKLKESKQIKELKKRALEMRKLGGKYKRHFGKEEMEQRKALLQEARNLNKEARELESYLVQKIIDDAQVITCTLIGSMHDYLNGRKFETVIIDEAGQGIEPATWVPIQKAEKVVMAGDPLQLPPTVKSQEAGKKGLNITLIEKIIQRQKESSLLTTQYRMHEQIMAFSNRRFYENKLIAHESVAHEVLKYSPMPVEFIDTAGCGFEEKAGDNNESRQNPDEAELVRKHLNELMEAGLDHESIGIISPYRAQVDVLREIFSSYKNTTVNTIDSFQGQERDVIYISMVRSNADGDIGFLKDYRRMNVAMTRARKKLVIVGDSATLGGDKFYEEFLQFAESIGAYRSAWEYAQ
jgi:ATP-dependent RNA/DNA helicase IGHMBP2